MRGQKETMSADYPCSITLYWFYRKTSSIWCDISIGRNIRRQLTKIQILIEICLPLSEDVSVWLLWAADRKMTSNHEENLLLPMTHVEDNGSYVANQLPRLVPQYSMSSPISALARPRRLCSALAWTRWYAWRWDIETLVFDSTTMFYPH